MDGILNINKPQGKTSFSIVALLKSLSGERHAGHAGTLDPIATGVLPICLGKATRIVEFLSETHKTYQAEIEFGVVSDTYDAQGTVTKQADASGITREQVESALDSFRGLIEQVPPMYSAIKYHGTPLYKLARAGVILERKTRQAQIYRLELLDWQPPVATLEIECGKGTYIRTLAHDLGQSLGCGAIMKSLIRTRYGPFDIKDSISIPELERAFKESTWMNFLQPIDSALTHIPVTVVNADTEKDIKNGKPVVLSVCDTPADTSCTWQDKPPATGLKNYLRAYTIDGRFLAILRFIPEKGVWQPKKVFA